MPRWVAFTIASPEFETREKLVDYLKSENYAPDATFVVDDLDVQRPRHAILALESEPEHPETKESK